MSTCGENYSIQLYVIMFVIALSCHSGFPHEQNRPTLVYSVDRIVRFDKLYISNPCCDVCYDFRIKILFVSSLLLSVLQEVHFGKNKINVLQSIQYSILLNSDNSKITSSNIVNCITPSSIAFFQFERHITTSLGTHKTLQPMLAYLLLKIFRLVGVPFF